MLRLLFPRPHHYALGFIAIYSLSMDSSASFLGLQVQLLPNCTGFHFQKPYIRYLAFLILFSISSNHAIDFINLLLFIRVVFYLNLTRS